MLSPAAIITGDYIITRARLTGHPTKPMILKPVQKPKGGSKDESNLVRRDDLTFPSMDSHSINWGEPLVSGEKWEGGESIDRPTES